MPIALTHFAARAGDHNDRAMQATPLLTTVLGERLRINAMVIGEPQPALSANWDTELASALPALLQMSAHYDRLLTAGQSPVTVLSRCAVALATLPMVAKHRPDAVVVWFDAHADLNTPQNSSTGYLGGLALAGPLGLWNSGLGSGLAEANAILAGTRDIDRPEQDVIDAGRIALIPVDEDMAGNLLRTIAGRPVYVHVDCDVLEPGTVPTDYAVPEGMSLAQLSACARALAHTEVVGLEIGELETAGVRHRLASDEPARLVTGALEPLLRALAR
ncbi:arginase family protein [Lacisediminihabitans sp.]|uniref:arginase family protein n=1 Tax=Lacisediminihabitans sp. TaxID=2787631 RepID=UPI002F9218F5